MQNRYIQFTSSKNAELLCEEMPKPQACEVVVKLAVSTISSGTERANLIGGVNISPEGGAHQAPVFPRRLGYSSAGVITEVGSDVKDLKVGDRVALYWSSHTEYCCMNERLVVKLPDDASFEDGAIAHISVFPLAAIRKCHLEFGESAAVMGLGILGLVAVKLLRAAGAAPVVAIDPDAEKRKKALELGADYVFDPFEEGFAEKVKAVTGGGCNVGIEVTGIGAGLDEILDCMARMGRVALLGCTRDSNFTIDYYRKVHGRGISLIGAHTNARPNDESSAGLWTVRDDMSAVLKMIALGRLSLASMVDETHSPEEAHEVYTRLANEKTFPIVQFDWRKLK